VILGFPGALVLAWVYETTPHGIRRTDDGLPASSGSAAPVGTFSPATRFGAISLLLAFGLTGAWWAYRTFAPAPPGLGLFVGASPVTTYPGVEFSPSFSPDGDRVVFSWNGGEGVPLDLYAAQIGTPTPQHLVESGASDTAPHWSPDGSQIAFFRQRGSDMHDLIVIPALGGQERKLREIRFTEAPLNRRSVLAWTPDSRHIVFSAQSAESKVYRLYRLALATGEAPAIPLSGDAAFGDMSPSVSPDGRWLAFTRFTSGPNAGELMVQRLAADDTVTPVGEPLSITEASLSPKAIGWSPDSRVLVFFDGPNFREWNASEGDVRTVYTATGGIEDATLAWKDGRPRIIASMLNVHESLWMVRLDPVTHLPTGAAERRASSTQGETFPALSPDGRRLVFASARTGYGEIWLTDAEGQDPRQVTRLNAFAGRPRWDRESKRIVFDARFDDESDGRVQLLVVDPDGAEVPRTIAATLPDLVTATWSADGQYLYAVAIASRNRVVRVRIADGATEPLFDGELPEETPDGKRILYAKAGESGIFMRSPEGDVKNNPEVRLLEDYRPPEGGWSAVANGIYYTGLEGPTFGAIRFFEYATGKSINVLPTPFRVGNGLTVSQDETRLWFPVAAGDSDLMLLEFEPRRE
jgi:Tol biopolymer transport system component